MNMLREDEVKLRAPSKLLLLLELRAWAELGAYYLQQRVLRSLPRGDGHPVMIIPGFGASDRSTRPLRALLNGLGYSAHGWGQGRNLGMRSGLRDALSTRLRELHEAHGKVTLIGWSLGGVFVREMARHQPALVRRVITLGSPINGHPNANNVYSLFMLANRKNPPKLDWEGFQKRRLAPPVPCVAIHSKSDGIVHWECSREEEADNTQNIEVRSSHFGLGFNPSVLRVIVEQLALK